MNTLNNLKIVKQANSNKKLSPAQKNKLVTQYELEINKEVLRRLKNKNNLSLSLQKQMSKKKKKKKKMDQQQSPPSYTSCQCMNSLRKIAKNKNNQISSLLRQKQQLIRESERLKYYIQNCKAIREAYFVEQIERRKLEETYLQQKLNQNKMINKQKMASLEKKYAKYKKQTKQTKSTSRKNIIK